MQPLGILAGYDFSIDRSLSDEFASIDRNGHTFTAGGQYTLSPRVTAGLNGTYGTTDYLRNVHNDTVTYSFGPVLAYELSSFVTIDAAAAYVLSNFEDTGTIGDQSDFSGFTVQLGVRHLINSRMSQDLRLRKGMELAFGANYLDLWSLQHTLSLELTSAITLQSRFVYELLEASIPGGETAERFLYYLGTTYQVTRIWSLGAGYSFAWKNSDLAGRDYRQNRLAFTLTRQF